MKDFSIDLHIALLDCFYPYGSSWIYSYCKYA